MGNTVAQNEARDTRRASDNAEPTEKRGRGRPRSTENPGERADRDLTGLEAHFKDVVINSGMVFVTVGDDIKKVKKELVSQYGPRRNARTNVEKQAADLTLKRFRQMFDLHGRHLTLRFIEDQNGKLVDERGKEVIHFQPELSPTH